MTVQTLSTLNSAPEGSSKLLISNGNSSGNEESTLGGMSFNAAMNQTVSDYNLDEQKYLLPDGQVLTAEQLLEMLKSGNTLPGLNMPTISELQQYKMKAGMDMPKMIGQLDTALDSKTFQLDPSKFVVNDKFTLAQQQAISNQFNQNQLIKPGITAPEQLLMSLNSVNASAQQTPDNAVNGFTAAYGYQLTNGISNNFSNSMSIATPVNNPQWSHSLGQSVQWMVNQNVQQVEIKLNPPDLGLLDIRVSISNDQATVSFTAASSSVRDALESALPRLRDMLEESGVSLADVNVSEHSLDQSEAEHSADVDQNVKSIEDNTVENNESMGSEMSSTKIGLLDTYA